MLHTSRGKKARTKCNTFFPFICPSTGRCIFTSAPNWSCRQLVDTMGTVPAGGHYGENPSWWTRWGQSQLELQQQQQQQKQQQQVVDMGKVPTGGHYGDSPSWSCSSSSSSSSNSSRSSKDQQSPSWWTLLGWGWGGHMGMCGRGSLPKVEKPRRRAHLWATHKALKVERELSFCVFFGACHCLHRSGGIVSFRASHSWPTMGGIS